MYDFIALIIFFVLIPDINMLAIDPNALNEEHIQAINNMLKHTSEDGDLILLIRQVLILVVIIVPVLIIFKKYKHHSNTSKHITKHNTFHPKSEQFCEIFTEEENNPKPLTNIQKSSEGSSHNQEIRHCKNLYFSKNYYAVIDYCQKLTYIYIADPAHAITTLYLAKSFDKTNQFERALSTYQHLLEITNNCPTIDSDIKLILDKKIKFSKKFNSDFEM